MGANVLNDSCRVIGHAKQDAAFSGRKPWHSKEVEPWKFRHAVVVARPAGLVKYVHLHPTPVGVKARAPNDTRDTCTAQIKVGDLVRFPEVR